MQSRRAWVLMGALGLSTLGLGACGTVTAGSTVKSAAASTAGTSDMAAGFHGAAGWRLTADNSFEMTLDGGLTWKADPLPGTVSSQDIHAVNNLPGGGLVVALNGAGSAVTVLSQANTGAAWGSTSIVPIWPDGYQTEGPAASVILTSSPEGTVSLVVGASPAHTNEYLAVFSSADGGRTFVQKNTRADYIWSSAVLSSATEGVAISGPREQFTEHTSDGGATWEAAKLPSSLEGSTLSEPIVTASGFLMASTSSDEAGTGTVNLLTSSDGQSFEVTGAPLVLPSAGHVHVASVEGAVWVLGPKSSLFVSNDLGATWTRVSSQTLPNGVASISLSTAESASIVVSSSSCSEQKGDCTTAVRTYATDDAGATWTVQ